ncbi:MAG: hypothetical protein AB1742_15320 [bacterium]
MKNTKKRKIALKKDNMITREELFKRKEIFHAEQAKLPFEEKIHALVRLQEIASRVKGNAGNKTVWKI